MTIEFSKSNRCYIAKVDLANNAINKEILKRLFQATYVRNGRVYASKSMRDVSQLSSFIEGWFSICLTLNLD